MYGLLSVLLVSAYVMAKIDIVVTKSLSGMTLYIDLLNGSLTIKTRKHMMTAVNFTDNVNV